MLYNGIIYTCMTLSVINLSGIPEDLENSKVLKRARSVCSRQYENCVRRLIKRGPQQYEVICGGRIKFRQTKAFKEKLNRLHR